MRVFQSVHDSSYVNEIGSSTTGAKFYYSPGQSSALAFAGTQEQAFAKWNAATNSIYFLNDLDLDYPVGGVNILSPTINSNSTYRTLGEIMGLPPYDFTGVTEPGLDHPMASQEYTNVLKYEPGRLNNYDWNSFDSKVARMKLAEYGASKPRNPGFRKLHPGYSLLTQSLVHASNGYAL